MEVKVVPGKGGKSSNIAEININENVHSDPKHIVEHLNDYFVQPCWPNPCISIRMFIRFRRCTLQFN